MSILKSKTSAIGLSIEPCFIITLHVRDLNLLKAIQEYFKVGSVSVVGKDARYRVRSRTDLKVIIDHFNQYPLQTSKAINFAHFCFILNIMNSYTRAKGLDTTGFLKLVALINRLNNPISKSTLDKISHLGPIPEVDAEIEIVDTKITKSNPDWI